MKTVIAKNIAATAVLGLLALGCSAENDASNAPMGTGGGLGGGVDGGSGGSDGGGSDGSGGDGSGGDGSGVGEPKLSLDAPDNAEELVPWLEAGNYKQWLAEPDYHESAGPHGNAVKVFYSDLAAQSIAAGDLELVPGSAVVKELTSGGSLYGWGVYVRGQETAGNAGVYFYELIKPSQVYGDAYNSSECTGCHSSGSLILSDLDQISP